MPTETMPTPERFFQTINGYQQTAALKTAIELDVFSAVAGGADTAAAIAARCQASERGVRVLCDYLAIAGFLIKQDGRYALAADSAAFLVRQSPAYLGGAVNFLTSPGVVSQFDRLTETVRRGTMSQEASTVADENPVWVEFARSMMGMMMPSAQAIAGLIGAGSGKPMRVLDIAAGHGLFGIVVAQANPQAEIVALDWAPVLDVAEEHAARFGVADRFTRLEGDALKIDFGTGYDAVLVTNFLHHFDPPTCTALLRKAAAALKEGGRVAILEFVPNPDRISPPSAAAFSLMMLAGTPGGDAYTLAELEAMVADAGLRNATAHVTPTGQRVVIAAK
jgi:2-polyprenyl-3-methyl-5-hydroxy-6-metoxy-1,4-benzoquinol methylase